MTYTFFDVLRFGTLTFWNSYVLKLLRLESHTFSDVTLSDITLCDATFCRSTVLTFFLQFHCPQKGTNPFVVFTNVRLYAQYTGQLYFIEF